MSTANVLELTQALRQTPVRALLALFNVRICCLRYHDKDLEQSTGQIMCTVDVRASSWMLPSASSGTAAPVAATPSGFGVRIRCSTKLHV